MNGTPFSPVISGGGGNTDVVVYVSTVQRDWSDAAAFFSVANETWRAFYRRIVSPCLIHRLTGRAAAKRYYHFIFSLSLVLLF